MNDIILTGLPRSGTTLTCELLNRVPDTVALDEPMDWRSYAGTVPAGSLSPSEACSNVARFFEVTRQSLLTRGVAVSKHVEGSVLGKKVSDTFGDAGVRLGLAERGEITIDKPLSPDFRLVVKQVAGFTALLGTLREKFPVYAIVRNPLSVLSSWQTVPLPIRHGHVVFGEALDPSLARRLAGIEDPLDRQLHVLGWFFRRFRDLLSPAAILRYEDIVAEGGRTLRCIADGAADLDVALESRNRNPAVYQSTVTAALGARLLELDGPWWHFYAPADVQELMP